MSNQTQLANALAILQQHPDLFRIAQHISQLAPLRTRPAGKRVGHVLFVDTETSGLNASKDHLIELGCNLHPFDFETGEIYESILTIDQKQALPMGQHLDPRITKITGICDADLVNQSLDTDSIHAAFTHADFVVSHNASFDRPFVEKACPFLDGSNIKWACSLIDINWHEVLPSPSNTLSVLASHAPSPFFFGAHRALADCEALAHLLNQITLFCSSPAILDLWNQTCQQTCEIYAINAPFETKDLLSSSGFRWNDGRSEPKIKAWSKSFDINKNSPIEDLHFLKEKIYGNRDAKVVLQLRNKGDRFSIFDNVMAKRELQSARISDLINEVSDHLEYTQNDIKIIREESVLVTAPPANLPKYTF